MIQRRTHSAPNAMGNMVPMLGSGYAAPATRWCASCGCRLRHGNHDAYCAPCSARINPWTAPEPRPLPPTVCPECGGYKKPTSHKCRRCRETAAHNMLGPRGTCECGRLARRGRRRCSHCDRERAAQ